MKWIFCLNFLLLTVTFAAENKQSELVSINIKVAGIMGKMHLPVMGISTLTGKGDFSSKYFKQASKDFISQAAKMAKVHHPDKAFRAFNNEMLQALKSFENSVKTEDKGSIEKAWKAVMNTCNGCHSVYHAKQK